MGADDDGFVGNPKKIIRTIRASEDDYKLLIANKFIIYFESGICVIRHWKIHNYIQKDRYKETLYLKEKSLLSQDENGIYTESVQDVSNMETQARLDKISIDKNSINNTYVQNPDKSNFFVDKKFIDFWEAYPKKQKKQDTQKWFEKNNPNDELYTKIMNKLRMFKNSKEWKKESGKYVPIPITWLQQKRWEDEIEEKISKYAEYTGTTIGIAQDVEDDPYSEYTGIRLGIAEDDDNAETGPGFYKGIDLSKNRANP